MMGVDRIFNMEQVRMVVASGVSSLLGFLTPTSGFIMALVIAFGFNVWCGMRADGVSVVNCRRFKFSKFSNAIFEVLIYLFILEVVFVVMGLCGDKGAGLVAIKTLTYIFCYVYLQNSFRNLVMAYPKNMALRIVYHVIRLEFTRAIPENVQKIIERLEKEKKEEEKDGQV